MSKMHPNLVKRPTRIREDHVGRLAYYYPQGLTTNPDIEEGDLVRIVACIANIKGPGGIALYRVTKETSDSGKQHDIVFTDLGFILSAKQSKDV